MRPHTCATSPLTRLPTASTPCLINSETRRQIATLEETHIVSARMLNSFRLGFSRAVTDNDHGFTAINPLANDPSLAALPGQFASAVTVPGITVFTGGVNGNSRYEYFWNSVSGLRRRVLHE